MQWRGLAALIVVLALVGVGCGGSEPSPPLSRAQFVKRADAVCARAVKQLSVGKVRGVDGMAQKVLAYQRVKVDGIGALAPPVALERSVERYELALAARQAVVDRYGAALREGGSTDALGRELARTQARENRAARVLGLKDCRTG